MSEKIVEDSAKPAGSKSANETGGTRTKVKILTKESSAVVRNENTHKTKKPEFLERALTRTDIKKRDAKPAIEAALAELSAALLAGEELILPPLGKLKVVKSKDVGQGAYALTLKLRTMKTEVSDFADAVDDV